jgi:hypothetical protein
MVQMLASFRTSMTDPLAQNMPLVQAAVVEQSHPTPHDASAATSGGGAFESTGGDTDVSSAESLRKGIESIGGGVESTGGDASVPGIDIMHCCDPGSQTSGGVQPARVHA